VIVNSLETFLVQVVSAITLDITANLKRAASEGGTPVDTGWARANWIPNIGSSFQGTAGTREAAEQGQINTGPQTAGEAAVVSQLRPGQTTHITNNVPYIVNLNAGSSPQAQPGFVEAAIAKAIRNDLPRKLGSNPTPRGGGVRSPLTGGDIPGSRT
jgi:hypothetical protein